MHLLNLHNLLKNMSIPIKSSSECAYACISLGEVMLRLDPGEGRIHTARQFKAWAGGGTMLRAACVVVLA